MIFHSVIFYPRMTFLNLILICNIWFVQKCCRKKCYIIVLDGKIVKIINCASLHSMIQNQTKGTFVVINDQNLQVPYIDFLCVDGGERKSFFSVTFRFRMAEQYWVLIKPLSTSTTIASSCRTLLCTWMIETTESISLIDILIVDFYFKNQKCT